MGRPVVRLLPALRPRLAQRVAGLETEGGRGVIRALGLDVSTVATGMALPDGRTVTIRPKAGASDPGRRLHEVVSRIDGALRTLRSLPQVAVIEHYALRAHPLALSRLSEVGGVVRLRLYELGIPYVEVPPAVLKMYAGKGNLSKPAMLRVARAAGCDVANHDEADAALLALMARDHYDRHRALEPATLALLDRLAWPEVRRTPTVHAEAVIGSTA